MSFNIMVVEDQLEIQEIVGKYLLKEGYQILYADNGIDALAKFNENDVHLIILDVMMPGIDGYEVLKEIRRISQLPIIMLTAKQEEVDRLMGFDYGADDYVIKPFSPKELMRRVRALLKRVYTENKNTKVIIEGELELHIQSQKIFKNGIEINITTTEFELLNVFFQNIGNVLSREQLIEKAFGYEYEGYDRSVDTHIKRIRQKIEEDSKNPRYLKTKYGAGYIFGG
ncbi:MAG: response regulator transcription factor [Eubacteriaceae bacterium]